MTTSRVEHALASLPGAPSDCDIDSLQSGPGEAETVRARSLGGSYDRVIYLVPDADTHELDMEAAKAEGSHLTSHDVGHIDGFTVVSREYFPHLYELNDFLQSLKTNCGPMSTSDTGSDNTAIEEKVVAFLTQTLEGVQQLHQRGLVHGMLQPKRIGFRATSNISGTDLVVGGAGIGATTAVVDKRYVAPEFAESGYARSPDGDIFAFMEIAADLLEKFRDDRDRPQLSSLEGAMRWLSDFYRIRPSRPSAPELQIFIETRKIRPNISAVDRFLDEYKSAGGRKSRKTHLSTLKDSLTRFPETQLAIEDPATSGPLAKWLSIDIRNMKPYYKGRMETHSHRASEETQDFPKHHFPEEMDDLLLDPLHRRFYGFPRVDEHDARGSQYSNHTSSQQEEWDALYETAVADLNAARRELLASNDFNSTREVVKLLEGADPALGRDELLVLRRWGHVLTVPDHGRWLYPDFQFRRGHVSPLVFDLHERLRKNRDGDDASAWIELTFWSTNSLHIGGEPPKDLLWRQKDLKRLLGHIAETGM